MLQILQSGDLSAAGVRLKDLVVQTWMGLIVKFPKQIAKLFDGMVDTYLAFMASLRTVYIPIEVEGSGLGDVGSGYDSDGDAMGLSALVRGGLVADNPLVTPMPSLLTPQPAAGVAVVRCCEQAIQLVDFIGALCSADTPKMGKKVRVDVVKLGSPGTGYLAVVFSLIPSLCCSGACGTARHRGHVCRLCTADEDTAGGLGGRACAVHRGR